MPIKLSEYARKHRIGYRAAWNRFKAGKIPGAYIDDFGNIAVPDEAQQVRTGPLRAAIYCRVSSAENRKNLDAQSERLQRYATCNGWQITNVTTEVGSGVNDGRKKLHKILREDNWDILVVEHKDRLTRFGFKYIEALVESQGKRIEVVNTVDDANADLMQDLVSVIYSFSARMYGLRRSRRKTEQIIACLERVACDDCDASTEK